MIISKRSWIVIALAVGCGNKTSGQEPDIDAAVVPEPDAGPPMLECGNPDTDAPIVWMTSPAHREIGVKPDAPLVFEMADGCGVTPSSIILRVGGTTVTPIVTGDPMNLRVAYDPPADFAEDAIVDAEVVASDDAGNTVTKPLQFRIWDDYVVGLRVAAGLDSATPATPSGWREYYHVETPSAGGQRMIGRIGFTLGTTAPGVRFVTARMRACVQPIPEVRTITAYRLNAPFDDATATWNQRSTGNTWMAAGADAVPGDRDAAPFATLAFQPVPGGWSQAESGDIVATVQGWYDDAAQNHGLVLVGAPGNVDVNNGNCPLLIRGFLGRPLP